MKRYIIKRLIGNVKFQCQASSFNVWTKEFDPENGHPRTQAARAMNEHIRREHKAVPFKLLDTQI